MDWIQLELVLREIMLRIETHVHIPHFMSFSKCVVFCVCDDRVLINIEAKQLTE